MSNFTTLLASFLLICVVGAFAHLGLGVYQVETAEAQASEKTGVEGVSRPTTVQIRLGNGETLSIPAQPVYFEDKENSPCKVVRNARGQILTYISCGESPTTVEHTLQNGETVTIPAMPGTY